MAPGRPGPDPAKVDEARRLAQEEHKTVTEIAAELGVDRRTVQRWGITGAPGRPRVADEDASPRTRRRRGLPGESVG